MGLLLSGCAASGAAKGGSSDSTTAPQPVVTTDTGSIAGIVTDDESMVIGGADVAIVGTSTQGTKTDDQGRFTFNGVEPGRHSVTAQRLGYTSRAVAVEVVAGETANMTLVLEPIQVGGEPRQEYSLYDGMMDLDFYTPAVTYAANYAFNVNVTKGASQIVTSVAWEASGPLLARYLSMSLTMGDEKNSTQRGSPITLSVMDFELEKAKGKAVVGYRTGFGCPIDPFCYAGDPQSLLPTVAYQQRLKFYSTVFYDSYAPEGYTGLP